MFNYYFLIDNKIVKNKNKDKFLVILKCIKAQIQSNFLLYLYFIILILLISFIKRISFMFGLIFVILKF